MRQDIGLINNDLIIKDNDFTYMESDTQHVVDTINGFSGWWKENVLDGVGLMQYMGGNVDVQDLNRKIRVELQSDGYKLKAPVVTLSPDGKLVINPNAEVI